MRGDRAWSDSQQDDRFSLASERRKASPVAAHGSGTTRRRAVAELRELEWPFLNRRAFDQPCAPPAVPATPRPCFDPRRASAAPAISSCGRRVLVEQRPRLDRQLLLAAVKSGREVPGEVLANPELALAAAEPVMGLYRRATAGVYRQPRWPGDLRERTQAGQTLSYIEGWYAKGQPGVRL